MAKKIEKANGKSKPGEVKPAVKNGKPAEPKKIEAPEKRVRNEFIHSQGTQSWIIDSLLQRGASLDDIAAKAKTSRGRVRSHVRHLETSHGQKIVEKDGLYRLQPKKGKEGKE